MKTDAKKFSKKLPVKLTDEEIRHRGEEAMRKLAELDDIDDVLQGAKDTAKAKKKPIQARFDDLKRQVLTRKEDRMVECEERFDWKRDCAETYRLDTKEKIATRPLSVGEKQMRLGDRKKKAAAKKKPVAKGKPDLKSVPPPAPVVKGADAKK